jgi:amino acid transporter
LVNEQLHAEKLSNAVALGVLSPDAISSSAYGTEEILVGLLPYAGLAAFTLLLPITGVIPLILILVAASYRQVVMAYTRAGGSYVVARQNFGPRIAQIAAAALLIEYVVTVAVQAAAGTVSVASALPALGPYSLEITVGVVLLIAYANLRGLREAGSSFAVPTYFFIIMLTITIVVGIIRQIFGHLTVYDVSHMSGLVPVGHADGLIMGASVLVSLRAFANGGSSLTGVEAISNTVSVFRKPQGANARLVLTVMAGILGFGGSTTNWRPRCGSWTVLIADSTVPHRNSSRRRWRSTPMPTSPCCCCGCSGSWEHGEADTAEVAPSNVLAIERFSGSALPNQRCAPVSPGTTTIAT